MPVKAAEVNIFLLTIDHMSVCNVKRLFIVTNTEIYYPALLSSVESFSLFGLVVLVFCPAALMFVFSLSFQAQLAAVFREHSRVRYEWRPKT